MAHDFTLAGATQIDCAPSEMSQEYCHIKISHTSNQNCYGPYIAHLNSRLSFAVHTQKHADRSKNENLVTDEFRWWHSG